MVQHGGSSFQFRVLSSLWSLFCLLCIWSLWCLNILNVGKILYIYIIYIYIKIELCLLSLYIFPECRSIAESKRLKDILRYPTYPTICFWKWFPYVLLKKWVDMASPSQTQLDTELQGPWGLHWRLLNLPRQLEKNPYPSYPYPFGFLIWRIWRIWVIIVTVTYRYHVMWLHNLPREHHALKRHHLLAIQHPVLCLSRWIKELKWQKQAPNKLETVIYIHLSFNAPLSPGATLHFSCWHASCLPASGKRKKHTAGDHQPEISSWKSELFMCQLGMSDVHTNLHKLEPIIVEDPIMLRHLL